MVVSSDEIISNRYHILSLLQRACTSHSIVSLQRPHEQFLYNSAILSIDNQQNCFIVDAPATTDLPLPAKSGEWLKFRIKLKGLVLSFEAVIQEVITDEATLTGYRLQLPQQVHYQQRRSVFRAPVGYQFKATCMARVTDTDSIAGKLNDLSLGGASIEIDKLPGPDIRPGVHVSHCRIRMDGQDIIIMEATIRSIQICDDSLERYRIGIEFDNISTNERRSLQRWVMKFDRENRKSMLTD